jgi:hypothetical protein
VFAEGELRRNRGRKVIIIVIGYKGLGYNRQR